MFDEKEAPLFNIFLPQIEVFTQQNIFMQNLLGMVKESFNASACTLRLLEEDKLTGGVSVGYKNPVQRDQTIRIDKKLREMLKTPEPLLVANIQNSDLFSPRKKSIYLKEGFKSCIFLPLAVKDAECIGILTLYFSHANLVPKAKIQSIQLFARMFAFVLHKSVLYEDILELKQLIQNVVEFTTDAILLTDELGKIVYVSKQAARLFKKRVSTLIGDYIFQFDTSQNKTMERALKQVRRRRSLINLNGRIQLPSGKELFLRASLTRLQLYRSKGKVYLWLIQDMTSLKKAELELNHKKTELEDFVYSVSHDLKSPIVSIQGYSALIKEDIYNNFDDSNKHYFDRIVSNVNLMQRMIHDLLELSRIGKLASQFKLESIDSILKDVLDEFYFQIDKREIKIVISKGLPRLRCDRKNLFLIFSNLLSNAIKFLGEQKNPMIEIGGIRKPDSYVFYVQDNGIGMTAKEKDKIFSVFYRSRKIGGVEGTGIGLTVVKKIVQYNNGQVWVESEEGKGSTFYFSLPKIIPETKKQDNEHCQHIDHRSAKDEQDRINLFVHDFGSPV